MFLVDGVKFELWCAAERESGLRARRHNKIQQPLNDAQMLAAWLLSIKGAHNPLRRVFFCLLQSKYSIDKKASVMLA